jgi:hypothetical protein
MREIGEVIDVSESRVCQIHARAAMNLKALLTAQDESGREMVRQNTAVRKRENYQLNEYQSQVANPGQISGGGK